MSLDKLAPVDGQRNATRTTTPQGLDGVVYRWRDSRDLARWRNRNAAMATAPDAASMRPTGYGTGDTNKPVYPQVPTVPSSFHRSVTTA